MEKKNDISFSRNCFDLLRYWAAISVMFVHYSIYAIRLSNNNLDLIRIIQKISTFFPGVVVLFSLSGFLITASFERSETKKQFFLKRVVRMYPELWGCTIVNFIVVFILANKYFDKSILVWLVTQVFGIANTPACLATFATGSINGALWTIFTEIQLYIVLGIAYKFIVKLNKVQWGMLLISLAGINVFCGYLQQNYSGIILKVIERLFLPYGIWFFIGSFCYLQRQLVLPLLKRFFVLLIICYTILRIIPIRFPEIGRASCRERV